MDENLIADVQLRREQVKEWEETHRKEYKAIVLDDAKTIRKRLAPMFQNQLYNITSIDNLDGCRRKVWTDFFPTRQIYGVGVSELSDQCIVQI